jgi:hypothetical protein
MRSKPGWWPTRMPVTSDAGTGVRFTTRASVLQLPGAAAVTVAAAGDGGPAPATVAAAGTAARTAPAASAVRTLARIGSSGSSGHRIRHDEDAADAAPVVTGAGSGALRYRVSWARIAPPGKAAVCTLT